MSFENPRDRDFRRELYNIGAKQPRPMLVASVSLTHWGRDKNGRSFADDTFKRIFLYENVRISIKISLKFVPKVPINTNPALVQIIAWSRSGDKPLSEPMMVSLLTHICVTPPQWVKEWICQCHNQRYNSADDRQCIYITSMCTPS